MYLRTRKIEGHGMEPLTMTPEREFEIREAAIKRGGFMDGLRMRALLAEIDALRKLVEARAPDPSVTPLSK